MDAREKEQEEEEAFSVPPSPLPASAASSAHASACGDYDDDDEKTTTMLGPYAQHALRRCVVQWSSFLPSPCWVPRLPRVRGAREQRLRMRDPLDPRAPRINIRKALYRERFGVAAPLRLRMLCAPAHHHDECSSSIATVASSSSSSSSGGVTDECDSLEASADETARMQRHCCLNPAHFAPGAKG